MEVPTWWYFSFWALTSITCLHLCFNAFDKTGLSTSVSPLVMSFLKHSLAISCCHSTSYALIFRPPQLRLDVDRRYFWLFFGTIPVLCYVNPDDSTLLLGPLLYALFNNRLTNWLSGRYLPELKVFGDRYSMTLTMVFISSEYFPWYFPVSTLINFTLIFMGDYTYHPEQTILVGIHMAVETSLFLVSGRSFPLLVLFVSFLTSATWAAISGFDPCTHVSGDPLTGDESFRELLPLATRGVAMLSSLKEKKKGKFVLFGAGMVGSLLFQNFFRLTTFGHVVAFLYLALSWVANLALLRASDDLGVLSFLLGNVIVGCTVGQFGLRGTTWIAYGASLVLYGLRLKIQSLNFVTGEGEQKARVVLW